MIEISKITEVRAYINKLFKVVGNIREKDDTISFTCHKLSGIDKSVKTISELGCEVLVIDKDVFYDVKVKLGKI